MAMFLVNASLSPSSVGIGGGNAGKRGDIALNTAISGAAVSGGTGDWGSSDIIFMSVSRCMNHFCIIHVNGMPDFATGWGTGQTEIQVSEALQVLRRDEILFLHSVCREEVQLHPSLLPTDLPVHRDI